MARSNCWTYSIEPAKSRPSLLSQCREVSVDNKVEREKRALEMM